METNSKDVLFKTRTGSYLYGLAHADSDEDFYTVLDSQRNRRARYAKQTIVDGVDSMTVDFGTWVGMCQSGVPQACEAMFSTMPIVDNISHFRHSFYVGTTAHARYLRAIKSFAFSDEYKKKRHALRLALNFYTLAREGRFNPTLDSNQIEFVNLNAYFPSEDVYDMAMQIAWL